MKATNNKSEYIYKEPQTKFGFLKTDKIRETLHFNLSSAFKGNFNFENLSPPNREEEHYLIEAEISKASARICASTTPIK